VVTLIVERFLKRTTKWEISLGKMKSGTIVCLVMLFFCFFFGWVLICVVRQKGEGFRKVVLGGTLLGNSCNLKLMGYMFWRHMF